MFVFVLHVRAHAPDRHGIYPENDAQEATAKAVLAAVGDHKSLGPVQTEVVAATRFWEGEDYHRESLP